MYTAETKGVVDQKQTIDIFRPKGFISAEVTVKEDFIVVKIDDVDDLKKVGSDTLRGIDVNTKLPLAPLVHGPLPGPHIKRQPVFRYYEGQAVLQPLTIALKFRNEAIRDTIPAQTESAFNMGVMLGYKVTKTFWTANKNAFNTNTTRVHWSMGGLLSMGSLELNSANTRNPRTQFAHKVPLLSYGFSTTIGINALTLGLAIGWDKTFTKNTDGWLYEQERWTGFIIGLDLIK